MGGAVYHCIMHASMRYVQYYAVDIAVDVDVETDAAIRPISVSRHNAKAILTASIIPSLSSATRRFPVLSRRSSG